MQREFGRKEGSGRERHKDSVRDRERRSGGYLYTADPSLIPITVLDMAPKMRVREERDEKKRRERGGVERREKPVKKAGPEGDF